MRFYGARIWSRRAYLLFFEKKNDWIYFWMPLGLLVWSGILTRTAALLLTCATSLCWIPKCRSFASHCRWQLKSKKKIVIKLQLLTCNIIKNPRPLLPTDCVLQPIPSALNQRLQPACKEVLFDATKIWEIKIRTVKTSEREGEGELRLWGILDKGIFP